MKNKQNEGGLYILMLSIHGLIRGERLELGRDADTGGQVKYVIELAKKLSQDKRVSRVDLLTRMVIDQKVDKIYSRPEEQISDNAYIIRIKCGPRRYLRKEVLWPYLDSFSDQAVQHIRRVGKIPDLIHGHYADAGYVGGQLARLLGVPFVFTGHSLGRIKRERLLEKGIKDAEIESHYKITQRIDAEEFALDTAALVVASTHQEVQEQYKLYEHYDPNRMAVIPPGVDLDKFFPPRRRKSRTPIFDELNRFLSNPQKPIVFAMSRADERKNIETLIHAFSNNSFLRQHANLMLVAGNRDNIREMDSGARKVLLNILYLIDKYDLYGKVAYPKKHEPEDVPELYRIAVRTKGVFVNPALTEPFGLTLIEAAASGLPLVATNDGGPRDIVDNCKNGELVDPINADKMGQAIKSIIEDKNQWDTLSRKGINGVRKHYSWHRHVKTYLAKLKKIPRKKYYSKNLLIKTRSRLPTIDRLIISDIDNTLIGDAVGLKNLITLLRESYTNIGFGIATGRRIESTIEILKNSKVPKPDVFITAVGSEIYYGESLVEDRAWGHRLDYFWQPDMIKNVLRKLPGLTLQEETEQRRFKISYYVDPKNAPKRRAIVSHLRKHNVRVKLIHSHNKYLDILPIRASKGLAVRYLAIKWGLPPERILVAGDSGNDEEMLSGDVLGVVVGNFSPELKRLYGKPRIYFAENKYANGIIEGIEHYNFLGEIKTGEDGYFETTT
ncbi:MAG: sucrose-phosphate phosphatase [Thermodesulfobacteriota bacterium]|nr:sucrose-phosphate phosphatase [Thermodesulfobacteriota bacterium]